MTDLSDDQLLRYARNILLKHVDVTGQQQLLSSHVVVVGAGGLGSPLLQYLAAAGVGELTIIDDDVVDETNLQRQVIHSVPSVGETKVMSAQSYIQRLNPEIKVNTIAEKLLDSAQLSALNGVDIVAIGTDNFSSRYLANQWCALNKVPLVTGAAIGTSGQITSFKYEHQDEPCFQCLYEHSDDEQLTCATAGVLGPVVGTIGSMMAMEVIKILLTIGVPLFGRLLVWDALTMEWNRFNYQQNSQCPVCKERHRAE